MLSLDREMQRKNFVIFSALFLSGCSIPSINLSKKAGYSHIIEQCYELAKPAFIFEGRCADLAGFNNDSELCGNIQALGLGGFPNDWASYLQNKKTFDKLKFDRRAFEKQRTMLFPVEVGTEFYFTKLVHHGWGTVGRFWVVRGVISINGQDFEVELPSFSYVHHKPYWFEGGSEAFPGVSPKFLIPCDEEA